MSAAKAKRREKKMRNQPANVQYPSPPQVESRAENGGGGEGLHLTGTHDFISAEHLFIPQRPVKALGVSLSRSDPFMYARSRSQFSPLSPCLAGAFARARAAEVSAMLKAATKTTCSSHVFQVLPKHMRRRAMSHNTKRLPRRLRDVANRMKRKEPVKSKSRKFNRRQRKNIWLETHIWHAKRFHMVKKWGYCLGVRPTYKCYRPCYRAMSSHCLLQDLSYYCCIELKGEEDKLLAALTQLTCKEAGPTFAAAMFLSGARQGSVTVYRAGRYPSDPLGPVTFLWRPQTPGLTHRQLWIWAHPALKQDLLPELQSACQCSEAVAPPVEPEVSRAEADPTPRAEPNPDNELKAGAKRKRRCKDGSEPPAKRILGDGTRLPTSPVTWRSSSTGLVINDLTMEIIRYRLIGPQSHSVLAETLEAATVCDVSSLQEEFSPLWWPEHCKDQSNMNLHQQQTDVFNVLKGIYSTGELPPGTVLGLTVDDPRLTLPRQKVKAVPCVNQDPGKICYEEKRNQLMLQGVPLQCCQSFLWERSVRDNVTDNKISEQDAKNQTEIEDNQTGWLISMMSQKHVDSARHRHKSSLDYYRLYLSKVPMFSFLSLQVYREVRVSGLHMSLKHSQNKAAPHFPHDYPDCPAGSRFQEEQEAEFLDMFRRRPPAKRTNYIKQGCLAPFRCPWQQLAEEWELLVTDGGADRKGDVQTQMTRKSHEVIEEVTSQQNVAAASPPSCFTVLRNRRSLRLLSSWCRPPTCRGQRRGRGAAAALPLSDSAVTSFHAAHKMSVVWVRLTLLSKGKPEAHAMVCAPTAEDLKLFGKSPENCGPQEPPHKDHYKSRINRKKKSSKTATPSQESDNPTASTDPHSPSDLLQGLWPDPLPSVVSHCSRVTLGWVTQGDFSLAVGRGEALGFVSVSGLLHTLLKQPPELRGTLLLRNPTSLHYRFVRLNIDV
uniref:POP1 homolog, ribonuclease P/MRP subunit n=1 Tax=Xiphophorus couchianus TaxID=32473 RepID=A0A3B5MNS3_9TELE